MGKDSDILTAKYRPFGPTHIVEPASLHTHTAILLHGRGSTGAEFAEEFFESDSDNSNPSTLSGTSISLNLAQKFPGWRWVFPSSPSNWNTVFEEDMPDWFDVHSLADPTAEQDHQIPGLTNSIRHVTAIIDHEIAKLDRDPRKIVLGGISQGAAVAIWTLFALFMAIEDDSSIATTRNRLPLGAFFGASTWIPFAAEILAHISAGDQLNDSGAAKSDAMNFVARMLGTPRIQPSTPVFLGHGLDDAYVDIELGRQARDVVSKIGFRVFSKDYVGAEQEGHWLKEPEEVEDIGAFLEVHVDALAGTH